MWRCWTALTSSSGSCWWVALRSTARLRCPGASQPTRPTAFLAGLVLEQGASQRPMCPTPALHCGAGGPAFRTAPHLHRLSLLWHRRRAGAGVCRRARSSGPRRLPPQPAHAHPAGCAALHSPHAGRQRQQQPRHRHQHKWRQPTNDEHGRDAGGTPAGGAACGSCWQRRRQRRRRGAAAGQGAGVAVPHAGTAGPAQEVGRVCKPVAQRTTCSSWRGPVSKLCSPPPSPRCRVLPPRVSEVIGVCHIKAYSFDDTGERLAPPGCLALAAA